MKYLLIWEVQPIDPRPDDGTSPDRTPVGWFSRRARARLGHDWGPSALQQAVGPRD